MAKSYIRDTSGLKRYHDAMREAKTIGGAYGEYVKQYYKVSRGLRKQGVKIKETGSKILDSKSFKIITKSEGISGQKLVAEQFGLLTGNQARNLQAALRAEGFDISIRRAMTRQLTMKEWKAIDAYYIKLQAAGYAPEAAALEISQYFFGS